MRIDPPVRSEHEKFVMQARRVKAKEGAIGMMEPKRKKVVSSVRKGKKKMLGVVLTPLSGIPGYAPEHMLTKL